MEPHQIRRKESDELLLYLVGSYTNNRLTYEDK